MRTHEAERASEGGETGHRAGHSRVIKVPSLLFDIELEDSMPEEMPDEGTEDMIEQIRSLLKPRSLLERQLTEEVDRVYRRLSMDTMKPDATMIAKRIRVPGHAFKIRTALGGNCPGSCLRQLRHSFLICSPSDSQHTVSCLVDPQFKEQFEIANPSKRYLRILAEVPVLVIASEECLLNLVNLLSNEMQQSFQVTDTTLPPWRHASSMMSKWRPRRSEDSSVHPASPQPSLAANKRLNEFKAGKVLVPRLDAFQAKQRLSKDAIDAKPATDRSVIWTGFVASPAQEIPSSMNGKRSREQGQVGVAYASLLANKLRGVTSFENGERLTSLSENTSQA